EGNLNKQGGVGAGLYLDAAPGVVGKAIEIQTPTPGFAVRIYIANRAPASLPYGDSTSLTARGWQGPVGQSGSVSGGARIPLELGGRPFRYYLVWITALPPKMNSASIGELTLFR